MFVLSIHSVPATLRVGLGEHIRGSGENYVLATVAKINQHPDYSSSTIQNDVTVIVLNDQIEINYARRPVCSSERNIANADDYSGDRLICTGWGTTSESGKSALTTNTVCIILAGEQPARAASQQ